MPHLDCKCPPNIAVTRGNDYRVAEFERGIIRERQAEGIRLAKARGVYRGRALRLTSEQVQDARRRVEEGVPLARVAREAKVSKQTLYDALAARGAYAGSSS